MPLVSVLLPNYNNAPYLKEALDSIFNQSFQDFIIYFVDDCSTDESLKIAESYNDDRLIIIKKESNSGIVDTMNIALDRIETKYFIRMDGDDISTPERFEKLVNYMEQHPEIGVCSSDIKIFGKENEILTYQRDIQLNKAHLIFCHSIGHASSIFRTSVFKDNSIVYKNRFWRLEDYHLFYDLKELTNTISIPGEFYLYRKEDHNSRPEIEEKKKLVFLKFYEMVLKDLEMEYNEKIILIHFQLSLRELPTFKFAEYKAHINKLLYQNSKKEVFPKKELKVILNQFLGLLVYRLIDNKTIKFSELFWMSLLNHKLLIYYLKKKES